MDGVGWVAPVAVRDGAGGVAALLGRAVCPFAELCGKIRMFGLQATAETMGLEKYTRSRTEQPNNKPHSKSEGSSHSGTKGHPVGTASVFKGPYSGYSLDSQIPTRQLVQARVWQI